MIPASRAASTERVPEILDVVGLGDRQRCDAPLERHVPERLGLWVSATIARLGRSRATADAVRPVNVGTRIAFAESASAMSHAAFDIAWPIVGSSSACGISWR